MELTRGYGTGGDTAATNLTTRQRGSKIEYTEHTTKDYTKKQKQRYRLRCGLAEQNKDMTGKQKNKHGDRTKPARDTTDCTWDVDTAKAGTQKHKEYSTKEYYRILILKKNPKKTHKQWVA